MVDIEKMSLKFYLGSNTAPSGLFSNKFREIFHGQQKLFLEFSLEQILTGLV